MLGEVQWCDKGLGWVTAAQINAGTVAPTNWHTPGTIPALLSPSALQLHLFPGLRRQRLVGLAGGGNEEHDRQQPNRVPGQHPPAARQLLVSPPRQLKGAPFLSSSRRHDVGCVTNQLDIPEPQHRTRAMQAIKPAIFLIMACESVLAPFFVHALLCPLPCSHFAQRWRMRRHCTAPHATPGFTNFFVHAFVCCNCS